MRQLPEALRATLETIALAEPLRFDIASALSGDGALPGLQARSMVVVDELGGVRYVKTAHPIYGATIRAMIPSLIEARLAAQLADTLIELGLRKPGDALRAAVWLQAAERPVPADIALLAANEELAKGDASLAEGFAALATESEESVAALIALGTALSVQRRAEEAQHLLERALKAARNEGERI